MRAPVASGRDTSRVRRRRSSRRGSEFGGAGLCARPGSSAGRRCGNGSRHGCHLSLRSGRTCRQQFRPAPQHRPTAHQHAGSGPRGGRSAGRPKGTMGLSLGFGTPAPPRGLAGHEWRASAIHPRFGSSVRKHALGARSMPGRLCAQEVICSRTMSISTVRWRTWQVLSTPKQCM